MPIELRSDFQEPIVPNVKSVMRSWKFTPLVAIFTSCTDKAKQHSVDLGPSATLGEELRPLQGHWEGDGAGGKCSFTIAGNSLVYRNSNGWYRTTFTLPPGAEPRQLHATIQACSPPANHAIGNVIIAIFKIENGTLLLAEDDGSDKPPKKFSNATSRYSLKKVDPLK